MPTTTFEIQDGPSNEQQAAETAALEQGEKLSQMQEEDQARKFEQTEDENSEAALIGGKFKSQDDLLKAYNELQKKLGQDTPEESDEVPEAEEETPEEAVRINQKSSNRPLITWSSFKKLMVIMVNSLRKPLSISARWIPRI